MACRCFGVCANCGFNGVIVPAILLDPADQTITLWDNPRLFAAALAIIAALVTRQMITTIGVGLVALWTLQWAM